MTVAYVETSVLVAIAFGERGGAEMRRRLADHDELVSANLLEAELAAAFRRESVPQAPELTAGLSWIVPDRPLSEEIARVLEAGYLRGADCWHLATALYLAGDPAGLAFLTLDMRQREVARELGFPT